MTDLNIYASPESDLATPKNIDRERASKVASRQKTLILLVVFQLLLNFLTTALTGQGQVAVLFIALLSLILMISVAVAAVRLSLLLNHIAVTVVLGILALLPLLNLIVLLILSGQSTRFLKSSGIRVGLLGARSKDIERI